ncbi:MAG: efflux RND transporter permease subunit [Lentisphaeria bacterium]|nr:efflux RND transporter permease subunit [Lentisphaeria bacterium]
MTTFPDQTIRPGPIAWMVRNPVAANLIMIVLLVGGLLSLTVIKQEVFPDFDLDIVNISVPYPGASPEEVERGIVLAIEENIRGLEGVDKISSSAREGAASVTVELLDGADTQKAYQEIKQEVDRITTFPDDAEEAVVTLVARKRDVIDMALYGDVPETVLREQAEIVRERLLQDPGITQVELSGVRDYEITVSVNRDTLRKYDLSLDGIARRIRELALELPGGGIKTSGGEILVRMKERRETGAEFGELPVITTPDGTIVRLKDIAEISDGFAESDEFNTYNGKPSVTIDIYRIGKQTPIGVATAAKRVLEDITASLPPTLSITVRRDFSEIFKERRNLLLKNGAIGLCVVMIILGLFLEIRLAFWVMMGIPISFLGGMMFMPVMGASINMISMFAFLIALGIVVDDAIVVGENVYEHRQRGDAYLFSSIRGTREVGMPVTFSVLTNIVTFLPLLFLPGFIGKIWFVIPTVVCTVFAISLFECLYILPAHLAHSKKESRLPFINAIHAVQQPFSQWFSRMVKRIYGPVLDFLLHHRYAVTAVGFSLLIITLGFVMSKRIGIVPMMRVEADYAVVSVSLPYGSPIDKTMAVARHLEKIAMDVVDENGGDQLYVGTMTEYGDSFRGTSGAHNAEIRVYLTESGIRPISTTEFTRKWREKTGALPGVEAILFQADRGGPGSGASLSLQLSHSDNDTLNQACLELADKLAEYPIVSDIDSGFSPGKVQLDFTMRPEGLALGLTASDVARQVRNSLYGASALKQQRGRNEIEVRVILPEEERVSEADLTDLLIHTPAGADVPLYDIAMVSRGRAYTSISHEEGRRTQQVSCNVTPPSESENILGEILRDYMPELRGKYPGLSYGFSGRQEDLREGMKALLLGFVVAIFVVYALLAIPFNSYTQPLIIMVCIPFGIVGAIWAHVFMGYPLSMISLMGIVALSGVVVNDSLVLIDFANGERKRGKDAHDAVCTAGIRRFRPILLTTLTTFGGLAPMIFETSRQARFMIPMAISLGYGIVFSTFITMVLVPCLYLIIEDLGNVFKAIFNRQPSETTS